MSDQTAEQRTATGGVHRLSVLCWISLAAVLGLLLAQCGCTNSGARTVPLLSGRWSGIVGQDGQQVEVAVTGKGKAVYDVSITGYDAEGNWVATGDAIGKAFPGNLFVVFGDDGRDSVVWIFLVQRNGALLLSELWQNGERETIQQTGKVLKHE